MRELSAAERTLNHMVSQYWALTKPRVTQLALFCAVIGMFLSTRELPPLGLVVVATVGIWLLVVSVRENWRFNLAWPRALSLRRRSANPEHP